MDARIPLEVVGTIAESLKLFESLYGPYPMDEMTVATTHRGFSQGSLSFLTLAHGLLVQPRGYYTYSGSLTPARLQELRTEIVSHEVAHQWWGGRVGWLGYRDQWLSEALADYSAQLFTYFRLGQDNEYRHRFSARMRRSLDSVAHNGRLNVFLGPVVLGYRLESSISDTAASTVLYDKGYLVFSTIAQLIGEVPFLLMLKEINRPSRGAPGSTSLV